jgi:hypothetical protein
MRITIPHNRPKADMIASVDRSFKANVARRDRTSSAIGEGKELPRIDIEFYALRKNGAINGTIEVTDQDLIGSKHLF